MAEDGSANIAYSLDKHVSNIYIDLLVLFVKLFQEINSRQWYLESCKLEMGLRAEWMVFGVPDSKVLPEKAEMKTH